MTKTIKKILIANRGEVAIRIMKTAKKMDIKTVAVYSNSDDKSYFLSFADEVYPLGGNLPQESYLDIEKIINAAKATGADAIHPGYGFLSENHAFAKAVEESGLIFIGPNHTAMQALGDKILAKQAAKAAGVSVVPGFVGAVDANNAQEIIKSIGFPLMIKAAAGGGGKGMRIVREGEDVMSALEHCVKEAINNFKDDRIFIEKYIEKPRHIEIQILSDKHGKVVCLGERECSIQRFNQKIVEEAPSPFVDANLRQKLYEDAVKLVKSCNYYSAGTIEYIVDKNKNFFFLEMNTRLQVEHGVTEMITEIDIVEQMINIAQDKPLPFSQEDIILRGHSVECRICAEDPSKGFIPSTGRITNCQFPKESFDARIETSYNGSGNVTPFYDAMIAKVISFGDSRLEAIKRMRGILSHCVIDGVKSNIFMLEAIMRNKNFEKANISTNFIKEEYKNSFQGLSITNETEVDFILAVCVLSFAYQEKFKNVSTPLKLIPDNNTLSEADRFCVVVGDKSHIVAFRTKSFEDKTMSVSINGSDPVSFSFDYQSGGRFLSIKRENSSDEARVKVKHILGQKFSMSLNAITENVAIYPARVSPLLGYMPKKMELGRQDTVVSPMSGLVTEVKVAVGDSIVAGQRLLTIEAMKMQNAILAECDGVVENVAVAVGSVVNSDDLLIKLK